MAGKGDTPRPVDREKYRANYEQAFGHTDAVRGVSGRHIVVDGELVPIETADQHARGRRRDNRHFRSTNLGCHPSQISDWEEKYGDTGVKFHPKTGDAIFPDRQSKLRFMRARSSGSNRLVDFDEVCG